MLFRRRRSQSRDPHSSAHPLDEERIGELVLPNIVVQPPAAFATAVLSGAMVEQFLLPLSFGLGWVGGIIGLVVGCCGVWLSMWSMQAFRRAASSPDPNHMPSALVVDGPFARTRNPLYLGTGLMAVGLGIGANMPWIVIALLPAMALIHFGVVLREEAYLDQIFGQSYRDYRARVRRWI